LFWYLHPSELLDDWPAYKFIKTLEYETESPLALFLFETEIISSFHQPIAQSWGNIESEYSLPRRFNRWLLWSDAFDENDVRQTKLETGDTRVEKFAAEDRHLPDVLRNVA
jgi:hypothetical protein